MALLRTSSLTTEVRASLNKYYQNAVFRKPSSTSANLPVGDRSALWLIDFETQSIKSDPILNNYLKQTIDNNVHSGVRRVTCFCLFVRDRISNRTAISLYFPDIFTNRKHLRCLLKICLLKKTFGAVDISSNLCGISGVKVWDP